MEELVEQAVAEETVWEVGMQETEAPVELVEVAEAAQVAATPEMAV